MPFKPAFKFPSTQSAQALWFIFHEDRLLLKLTDDGCKIPCSQDLARIKLSPIRSQYLGSQNGLECYTAELPDKSSRMDLEWNDDGSVDLYFGPELPEGAPKQNWVKTVPGEGWFTYFRLYAPTQPYFDGSWQLPDIEKVK